MAEIPTIKTDLANPVSTKHAEIQALLAASEFHLQRSQAHARLAQSNSDRAAYLTKKLDEDGDPSNS